MREQRTRPDARAVTHRDREAVGQAVPPSRWRR